MCSMLVQWSTDHILAAPSSHVIKHAPTAFLMRSGSHRRNAMAGLDQTARITNFIPKCQTGFRSGHTASLWTATLTWSPHTRKHRSKETSLSWTYRWHWTVYSTLPSNRLLATWMRQDAYNALLLAPLCLLHACTGRRLISPCAVITGIPQSCVLSLCFFNPILVRLWDSLGNAVTRSAV